MYKIQHTANHAFVCTMDASFLINTKGEGKYSKKLHCPIEVRANGGGVFTLQDNKGVVFQVDYSKDIYLDGVLLNKSEVKVGSMQSHLDTYIGNRCHSLSTTTSDQKSYYEYFTASDLWLFSVQHFTNYDASSTDFEIEVFDSNGGEIDPNNVFITYNDGIYKVGLSEQSGKVKITVYGYEGESAPVPYIEAASIDGSDQVFAHILNGTYPFSVFSYRIGDSGSYTDIKDTTTQAHDGTNVQLCTLSDTPESGDVVEFLYRFQGDTADRTFSYTVT